jgi:histidinol-phosphatase (PHP family)
MIDSHVHLWRHNGPTPTPSLDDLAHLTSKATSAGVDHVVIAEHLYRFRQTEDTLDEWWNIDDDEALRLATARIVQRERTADLDSYVAAIAEAKAAGLPLSLGLELDYFAGADDSLEACVAPYPFDVILGSVHWLGAWLFDAYAEPTFAAEWRRRSVTKAWDEYTTAFESLCRSGLCDVVAHCDLIKVAGIVPDDRTPWEDRMLDAITNAGVAVEVCSAGFRKAIREPYPSPRLLEALLRKNVPVVLSSDAHLPAQIGDGFAELVDSLRYLKTVGLARFSGRQRSITPMV